jgi:protein-disulfide isomerase/uncharacterized coiled-coil protein SlyX
MRKTTGEHRSRLRAAIAVFVLAAAVLSAGHLTGCKNSSADSGPETVKVVLEDGTPLEKRLNELESAIAKQEGTSGGDCSGLKENIATSNDELIKEMQKLFKNNSLMNIRPNYPPIQHFDISEMPSKGSKDAVVTILEFSDFQCPYCARMALYLDSLVKKNPDKIRLVFVDRILVGEYRDGFPFHPYAMTAHEAAAEAKSQGKFWEMYTYIFENQKKVFPGGRPQSEEDLEEKNAEVRETLIKAAGELGLDKKAMRKALENHTHREALEATNKLVRQMDINSTPTVWTSGFFHTKNPTEVLEMINNATVLE